MECTSRCSFRGRLAGAAAHRPLRAVAPTLLFGSDVGDHADGGVGRVAPAGLVERNFVRVGVAVVVPIVATVVVVTLAALTEVPQQAAGRQAFGVGVGELPTIGEPSNQLIEHFHETGSVVES